MGIASMKSRAARRTLVLAAASLGFVACTPTTDTQPAVGITQTSSTAGASAAAPRDGVLPRPVRHRVDAAERDGEESRSWRPPSCTELLARCAEPSECLERAIHNPWTLYDTPFAGMRSRTRDEEREERSCRRTITRRIAAGGDSVLNAAIRSYDSIPHMNRQPHLVEEVLLAAPGRAVDVLLASGDPNALPLLWGLLDRKERERPEVKAAMTRKAAEALAKRDAFTATTAIAWLGMADRDELRPHVETLLLAMADSIHEPDDAGMEMIPGLAQLAGQTGQAGRGGFDDPRIDQILRRGLYVRSWRVNLTTIDAIYESGRVPRFTEDLALLAKRHWMPLMRAAARGDRTLTKSLESLATARREHALPTCDADPEANSAWGRLFGREPRRFLLARGGEPEERRLVEQEAELPRDLPRVIVDSPTSELPCLDTHRNSTDAMALADGGWLVSFDRGEFGGALVYVDAGRDAHVIALDAFSFFIGTPTHLLVLHPALDDEVEEARLYRVDTTTTPPLPRFFTALPANVIGYWQEDDGTLLFATRAGLLSVDTEGNVSEVGCVADAL
jgi:hypothetical protein